MRLLCRVLHAQIWIHMCGHIDEEENSTTDRWDTERKQTSETKCFRERERCRLPVAHRGEHILLSDQMQDCWHSPDRSPQNPILYHLHDKRPHGQQMELAMTLLAMESKQYNWGIESRKDLSICLAWRIHLTASQPPHHGAQPWLGLTLALQPVAPARLNKAFLYSDWKNNILETLQHKNRKLIKT